MIMVILFILGAIGLYMEWLYSTAYLDQTGMQEVRPYSQPRRVYLYKRQVTIWELGKNKFT
jgi:hypothetical protein